jgi:putative membrane protein
MLIETTRPGLSILAVAVLLTACGGGNDARTDTAGAVGQGDTSAVAGTAAPAWTDANIFALLDQANVGDSTHGAIASSKGTSSAVRDFGRQMMRDHHTLRVQGEALAKRLTVTPTPPANDTLAAAAQRTADMLNTTAKGKDFDKAYIDHEVAMHKSVLEMATQAMAAAQSTELKNLIQKATPTIQAHLDKSQQIQRTMQ